MKILTIIGARPQFIKASVVSKAISEHRDLQEIILHTGQHFDANMSAIFFEQLGIPRPDFQLDIHGGSHGEMTGRMLIEIERVIQQCKPDRVLVYGDTNSTLAGALAAAKLHVPVAHIEAGLRSFNMQMPEEINRILTDNVSDVLFCPTDTAVKNLRREGFQHKAVEIYQVGDVMQDAALFFAKKAAVDGSLIEFGDKHFILATLHRAENTDDELRLTSIIEALNEIHRRIMPVLLPLHPRTKAVIAQKGLPIDMFVIEPVGYLQMIWLLKQSQLVITDSGGVQKEAFFFQKPCVTMRDQTEWIELIEAGVNTLAGADKALIINSVKQMLNISVSDPNRLYGGGKAAQNIIKSLVHL